MEETQLNVLSNDPLQSAQGTTICFIPYSAMYAGDPGNTAPVLGEPVTQSAGAPTYSIVAVSQPPAATPYDTATPNNGTATPNYGIVSGLSMLPDYAELPRCNSTDTTSSVSSMSTQSEDNQHNTILSDTSCDTNWNTIPGQGLSNAETTGHTAFWSVASFLNRETGTSQTTEQTKPKKRGTNSDNYRRYPKPPYSYTAMLIMAIENSPERKLTLAGIHDALQGFFDFFNGEYTGWKDSIRHNLSNSPYFYKDTPLAPKANQSAKPCFFWRVDLSNVPAELFHRQTNRIAREGNYKKELHEQLGLPPVVPPSTTPGDRYVARNPRHTTMNTTEPSVSDSDKLENGHSTASSSETEVGSVNSLWKVYGIKPLTVKVEQRTPAKDSDPVKMKLPVKTTANANVATDSPEHLRVSDLPHAKRRLSALAEFDSLKVDSPTFTSLGQSPLMSREMEEIFTFVTSSEHANSPDTAVNNLSLLCSPDTISNSDNVQVTSETHVPSPHCQTTRPLLTDENSANNKHKDVKVPIVEYIVHNGSYTIHHRDDATAKPYDPYAPLPKRPRTESSQDPTYLVYKSPLDFFADSAIAFGQK